MRDRSRFAFALASAAVSVDVQYCAIRAARFALGGVGTKPWRSREAERALVLEEWNRTAAEYPTGRCIHELFEAQAARTPGAVAVVVEDGAANRDDISGGGLAAPIAKSVMQAVLDK